MAKTVIIRGPEIGEIGEIVNALSNFFSKKNKITLLLENGKSEDFRVTSFKRASSLNEVEIGLTSIKSGEKFKARYNTQLLLGFYTPSP
ncbi:MAG: hypothetical protein Q4A27_01630 [bacterium]|nr:hypothetical protein [bacterium]